MRARDIIMDALEKATGKPFGASAILSALTAAGYTITSPEERDAVRAFALGDRVTKTKGSSWTGRVVGFYSTALTPVGYCVESENEPGSVQIYPEAAIRRLKEPSDV